MNFQLFKSCRQKLQNWGYWGSESSGESGQLLAFPGWQSALIVDDKLMVNNQMS